MKARLKSLGKRKLRRKIEQMKRKLAKEKPSMAFDFGSALAPFGPIIETEVGVTEEHARHLRLNAVRLGS